MIGITETDLEMEKGIRGERKREIMEEPQPQLERDLGLEKGIENGQCMICKCTNSPN